MTKKETLALVEQFVIDHQHQYYRLAFSYVKNRENALDIVQDSIVKALRSIHQLKDVTYIKTWFYRIVINTSIDYIRKHGRVTIMEDTILSIHLPTTENEVQNIDLQRAIDGLNTKYKTVILLRFFEDLKIEEIAMITEENANTVKTRLYAALKKLRVEIGEEHL